MMSSVAFPGSIGIDATTNALAMESADSPSMVTLEPNLWMIKAPRIAPATPPLFHQNRALLAAGCVNPEPVSVATSSKIPT
jgi:hypothetical protein